MPDTITAEVRINKVVAGGDGLARGDDGRVVFVPGALPGERVRVRLTSAKRDFGRAELLEVLDAHPGRVEPPCPYVAAGCGGCSWQHVAADTQRELKHAIVLESLVRTGRLVDPMVGLAAPLPDTGFRTTLRLAVTPDGRVGFRARARHDVVPVEHCLVAHPQLDELLAPLRVEGTGAADAEVVLRLGVGSGQRGAALAVEDGAPVPTLAGLPDDVAVGDHVAVHEDIRGAWLRVSMGSFFQTRRDGAEALVDQVAAAIGTRPASVVDAYGGVGLFAATVGADGDVVVLEGSASSCADARQNLRGAGVVVLAPVEKWVPRPVEVVIADPSRSGLGKVAASVLTATAAPTFVLVSCDAVSLARDAALLAGHGYGHAGSVVLDLFPHTPHVEVVTRFAARTETEHGHTIQAGDGYEYGS